MLTYMPVKQGSAPCFYSCLAVRRKKDEVRCFAEMALEVSVHGVILQEADHVVYNTCLSRILPVALHVVEPQILILYISPLSNSNPRDEHTLLKCSRISYVIPHYLRSTPDTETTQLLPLLPMMPLALAIHASASKSGPAPALAPATTPPAVSFQAYSASSAGCTNTYAELDRGTLGTVGTCVPLAEGHTGESLFWSASNAFIDWEIGLYWSDDCTDGYHSFTAGGNSQSGWQGCETVDVAESEGAGGFRSVKIIREGNA